MESRIKYGIRFHGPAFLPVCPQTDANIELYCFREWLDTDTGQLGRYAHLKNAISLLWPDMEFNEWFELRLRAFCDPNNWVIDESQRFLSMNSVGCAASGKTHDSVVLGFTWWLADPENSRFSFCSAQKQMIEGRSWAVFQDLYNSLGEHKPGHLINSKHILQSKRGDSKHCVDILASAQGETDKAVQRLAGNHPKRYFIAVDEASDTPEAIFAAVTNASKACAEFVFMPVGNAWSRMDPLGRCCTPASGWNTVNRDTEMWKTTGVREWNIKPGVAIHFSGRRSPNVRRGKTFIKYLYTRENWIDAQGNENSLGFWRQDEGFWAPEGLVSTVFDEAAVSRVGGMGRYTWESKSEMVAALDPAFGGDEIKLKFGTVGDIEGGRLALEVGETVPVIIEDKPDESAERQIGRQIIQHCKKRGVKPECFGLDATGTGRGVASYLQDNWSPMINKVEFGGAPDDAPVSADDPTSMKDAYDRKVTQLWYQCREMLLAGQLRGLDAPSVQQFCKRMYDYRGKKIVLEKKDECRARIGRSPDDADCVAVMCHVARQRGVVVQCCGQMGKVNRWLPAALEADAVYETDAVEESGPLSWFDDS